MTTPCSASHGPPRTIASPSNATSRSKRSPRPARGTVDARRQAAALPPLTREPTLRASKRWKPCFRSRSPSRLTSVTEPSPPWPETMTLRSPISARRHDGSPLLRPARAARPARSCRRSSGRGSRAPSRSCERRHQRRVRAVPLLLRGELLEQELAPRLVRERPRLDRAGRRSPPAGSGGRSRCGRGCTSTRRGRSRPCRCRRARRSSRGSRGRPAARTRGTASATR